MPNFAHQYSTALSRESDEEKKTEVGNADQVAKLASEDSIAPLTQTAAGVSIGTPQQLAQVDALALLVSTVKEFEESHRRAAAAGVSASMKQKSPQFDVRETEYRTFRRLVEAAEMKGLISTTVSGSDLDLHSVETTLASGPLKRLDNKLWRAFLEWDPEVISTFDRRGKRVVSGPAKDASYVTISSIGQSEQVEWMRLFAAQLPEGAQRDLLLAALSDENPARAFSAAVREEERTERKWRTFLQKRVLDRAQEWALTNSIPIEDLDDTVGRSFSAASTRHASVADRAEAEAAMRERVLAILGAMPLSELLRLPIPIEYTLLR